MAEVQWYYARNDQQFGPVSAAELKQLADDGKLSPNDLLWREGMDSWNTAINLRGLFSDDAAQGKGLADPMIAPPRTDAARGPAPLQASGSSSAPPSLRSLLRTTQIILWTICVLVVLAGVILFTRAFLSTNEPSEQAAAGAIFSTFFIAAYVLARTGEKLSRLLLAASRRRSR